MAQRHLDRLAAIDASFLHQEGPNSHMHVGGLTVVEGPAPPLDDLLEQIRRRLHLVPRYRHKLANTVFDSGRPLWVDDPTFHLEYHVRHAALPTPGDWQRLCNMTAEIFSRPLDRSRPLWEMWLIEGMDDGNFALISKNHHALIDGIAGVDLVTVLFDLSPTPAPVRTSGQAWRPHAEPGTAEMVGHALRGAVGAAAELASGAFEAVAHPDHALHRAREAAEALGEVVRAGLDPAPPTPLNVKIGPHRRFAGVRCDLADFKLVKNSLGGTVNDVVLSVVTGALRSFLLARGADVDGLRLRALVPVSVRAPTEHGQLGNRIAAMRGPLPVYVADPLERLELVRGAMEGLKESKQALGAEILASVQNFAPPNLLAQASRLNFSTRFFNLLVTNVPGPQLPLYILGREILHAYPVAFLPERHALAVAIMSYNGEMNFGLLGDFDALPDIGSIADNISHELRLLVDLARTGPGA